jgi:hypothetical protein
MQIPNTTLDDICAVIGLNATVHLVVWFGDDNSLYVPDKVDGEHFLARLIGLENATRLSAEWPSQIIHIPSFRAYEDLLKRKQIGRQFEMGFGSREIATQFRVTERRVQQICRELESAGLIPVIGPTEKSKKPFRKGWALQKLKGSNAATTSWPSLTRYKIK